MLFDGGAQMDEMTPSGITGHERAAEDFAGVVVERENECGISVGGPPGMRRGIVLPEFPKGGALPAATGFGTAWLGGQPLRKVLADISGHGCPGAVEVETTGQFVGEQSEVKRLSVRQATGQKVVGGGWPVGRVVAARGLQGEGLFLREPAVAELVEAGGTEVQPLSGGQRVELAGVKGGENFLNVEGRDTMSELSFFIGGPA